MSFLFALLLLQSNEIYLGEMSGVISPASSAYILRAISIAEEKNGVCLIIKLDTPGGLDESMREITKRILNTRVPVVIYVAPRGARAASAGVFILYSSHIAAMAPGTNIGAAHPVGMGGEKIDTVMASKVTNDAVAYLQSLAKARNRNIEWAEKAVRQSASIDDETALKIGVCEVLADDEVDLINKLDGKEVRILDETIRLNTKSAPLKKISMSLREKLLLILTNPNIAYILLLLGIYGLFFELQNPGMIFPGVVGAICLILGFYALHLLPVNYAGLALILLSAIFFILEIYVTSHGLLSVGGVISLIVGSLILFESDLPFLKVSWEVIMVVVIITIIFVGLLLFLGIKAQFRKPAAGKEGLLGEQGITRSEVNREGGTVFVHGELWNAVSDTPIKKGVKIKVIGSQGMVLKVEQI